ncbi:hypothetical protein HDV00_008241 [Rhizophlyctis rosea]|nr:hypothetical protein HDV00_008241 [Rhizophlyctis rosea]
MSGGIYGAPIAKATNNMALQKQAEHASKERHRRQEEFHQRLLARVKHHHTQFLLDCGKEVVDASSNMSMWDPRFKLQDVPDIERIHLESLSHMPTSANNFPILERKCDPKLEVSPARSALASDCRPSERTPTSSVATLHEQIAEAVKCEASTTEIKPKSRAAALLDRVRARQKQKMDDNMHAKAPSPAEVRAQVAVSKLPEIAHATKLYVLSGNVFNHLKSLLT